MKQSMYKVSRSWYIKEILKLCVIGAVINICFFQNIVELFLEIPMLIFIYSDDYKEKIAMLKEDFVWVFSDVMQSVSAGVAAGRSLENAFIEAVSEVNKRGDVSVYIKQEWERVVAGLSCNQNIEEILDSLGSKSGIKDIKKLVRLMGIAKTHGGDLLQLIRNFNQTISRKRILKEELYTMVSEKKLESSIMLVMPLLIIVYVRMVNPGYLDIIYSSASGRVMMCAAMLIVFLAYVIQRKVISRLKVGI